MIDPPSGLGGSTWHLQWCDEKSLVVRNAAKDGAVSREGWPDVCEDGFAILAGDGHLRASVAPTSTLDLFAALDGDGRLLLADTAKALIDALGHRPQVDVASLAERLSDALAVDDPRTVHKGIYRVLGGYELHSDGCTIRLRRWWHPKNVALARNASVKQFAQRLRDTAEAAIERHLPAVGPAAVQLSGGRDSSLVCALVATRLAQQGREVHAFTALPCAGEPIFGARHQYDESEAALATSSRFANVRHQLLRPEPVALATILDDLHRHLGEPLNQPVSLSWMVPQLRRCRTQGISALLTGAGGNFTVSSGGLGFLPDVLAEEGPVQLLRSAAWLRREGGVALRDLVRVSIGAWLPRAVYQALRRRGQPRPKAHDFPFFRGPLRARLLSLADGSDDPRPPASFRAFLQEVAGRGANLVPIGRFNYEVEVLGPWMDRDLFELLLSVPTSLLVSPPDRRQLYDEAFRDILPVEVLRPARRGMQNVDFHAAIDRGDLSAAMERYRASDRCREMIDLDQLSTATAVWPTARCSDMQQLDYWVNQYLPALSLASFLYSQDAGASSG